MKTSSELLQYLVPLIGARCSYQLSDNLYSLPDKTWFFTEFPKALKSFQMAFGLNNYQEESNDCDNFAKIASSFADILHIQSKGIAGIAIGEFWFISSKGNHALNFAIHKTKDNNLQIVFLEPQTLKQTFLTEKEIESCYLLKM